MLKCILSFVFIRASVKFAHVNTHVPWWAKKTEVPWWLWASAASDDTIRVEKVSTVAPRLNGPAGIKLPFAMKMNLESLCFFLSWPSQKSASLFNLLEFVLTRSCSTRKRFR